MISFTTNIKNEIANYEDERSLEITMLSAIVRNNAKIYDNSIEIVTENNKTAKRLFLMFKNIYNVIPIIEDKGNSFNRSRLLIIKIFDKIDTILNDLGVYDDNHCYLPQVPNYLIDSEDSKRAYLKGVFLACGSINDPKTSRYHLEFFFDKIDEANLVNDILNDFYLNSKMIKKDKKYMVYVKEAEKIGDFLRIINAPQAVMYYEDIRIYRDHKNMTNRLNNMEQANIDKMIRTCEEQIDNINLIMSELGRDFLDERTLEVCDYRLKYPESSLLELSEIISLETGYKIGKSGLNHRFRKIKELANQIRKSKN